jgi:short-subunit dehydrogenase
MNKYDLNDKVIIITGASAGIGKELALKLSKQKVFLSLAARNQKKLEEIASLCEKNGANVLIVPTDVSEKDQCKHLINKTIEKFGKIDILINNAGISMWAKFDEITEIDLFEKIMKTNYLGSVYCTFFALPYLKKSYGLIVAISSLTGKTGVPTRTAYSASKHAMAGFFDSLRIELMNSGVDVTVIYPGFVATEVRERALGKDGKQLGKSHLNESQVMSVEECASKIINAMEKRKRELVMTSKARIGLWLKLIAPKLVDKISLKTISEGK